MASFNKVLILGNLTRDPQMKYLPSQMPVCDFGIATNRRFKTQSGEDREEVCFVDCTAFGKQAEVIHQWCGKGKPIFIEGRLKFDQWDDKNGGGKRHKLTVVVEQFQFIPTPRDGAPRDAPRDDAEQPAPQSPATQSQPATQTRARSAPARPRANKTVENPVSEKAMFAEADIPF
jgi:single-strand DNA-binding protein